MAKKSEPEETAEATVSLPLRVVEAVKAELVKLEYSAPADAGKTKCPTCGQSAAMDPANPRDFENHASDCSLGNAIAALG